MAQLQLKLLHRFLFIFPIVVAWIACSVGRYQLRHMQFERVGTTFLEFLVEFFGIFFLVFALSSTVAVTASALSSPRKKLAFLGAVISALAIAFVVEVVFLDNGFLSGGLAQFIYELPFVIPMFGFVIPLLSWLKLQPNKPVENLIQEKESPFNRLFQVLSIVTALVISLGMKGYISWRFELLRISVFGTVQEKAKFISRGSRAFFEIPNEITGSSETITILAIGLAAYLMIPIGFAMSSRHWLGSLLTVGGTILACVCSLGLIYYLGLSSHGFSSIKPTELQADAMIYVLFFTMAGIPYFLFGFFAGKCISWSHDLRAMQTNGL